MQSSVPVVLPLTVNVSTNQSSLNDETTSTPQPEEHPESLTRRPNDPSDPDTFEFEAVIQHHKAQELSQPNTASPTAQSEGPPIIEKFQSLQLSEAPTTPTMLTEDTSKDLPVIKADTPTTDHVATATTKGTSNSSVPSRKDSGVTSLPIVAPAKELVRTSIINSDRFLHLETKDGLIVNTYQAQGDVQYRLPFIGLRTVTGHTLLALVDTGATVSLIDHASAERVGLLKIAEKEVTINCYSTRTRHVANIYEINIHRQGSKFPFNTCITGTPTMPNIRFHAPILDEQDRQFLLKLNVGTHSLNGLRVFTGYKIDMILGNDKLYWITEKSVKYDLPSSRRIEKTQFGLIAYPTPAVEQLAWEQQQVNTMTVHQEDDNGTNPAWRRTGLAEDDDHPSSILNKALTRLWETEIIGIAEPSRDDASNKMKRDLLEEFNANVVMLESGELQVHFPWNGNQSRLTNNFPIAKVRMASQFEKLRQGKEGHLAEYDKIIQTQLASGIIELVTDLHRKEGTPEYYIPHRAVFKTDSFTTKIRIVLDASSKGRGKLSLNDCQFPGPSILESIFGILMRSRITPYILVADIEKAFHQVRLVPACRNVTRFLWVKDITKKPIGDNIVEFRFTRLPFGVTSSPFLLAATIKYFLDREPNRAIAEDIQRNLYVDNIMITIPHKSQIMVKYGDSKETFSKMQMNLREYVTNSQETMSEIPEADRASSTTIKLLGYKWDSIKDTFTVKIAKMEELRPSKRKVASRLAETFDPLGLVSPLLIDLKLLMQRLWINGISWNQPIPVGLQPQWDRIRASFAHDTITIPRQMTQDYNYKSVQLLMFSDANKDFYACAAYLHYEYDNSPPVTRLLASKSKIRPSKSESWTIPKMELMGIEIASTLAVAIQKELHVQLDGVKFFSDSMCAIYWILLKEIKRAWVSNRVNKIHANRDTLAALGLEPTIHHCPGDKNPADLATRGLNTTDLQNSTLWFEGPDFLKDHPSDWPCAIQGNITCPEEFRQLVYGEIIEGGKVKRVAKALAPKATPSQAEHVLTYGMYEETCTLMEDSGVLKSIIPFERTNSMERLVSITRLLLQACKKMFPKHKWKGDVMKEFCKTDTNDFAHERKVARNFIIEEHYKESELQQLKFPDGITAVKGDDRLYRVERLTKETPVLIHHQHKLARLLMTEAHLANQHAPTQFLVNCVRTHYWIPHDGSLAKHTVRSCVNCRRLKEKPFTYSYSKILPNVRTTPSAPFRYCGLDYLGPLQYLKDSGEKANAYVLLYTCLVTRAVHVELLRDGTTREYIKGLQNVFSRRGVPRSILSDNARTFTLGAKLINRNIAEHHRPSTTLTELLAREEIDFHFITPLAPWQGGIYERIVGLVKHQLFKIIRKQILDFFDLQHTLIKVESLLNNRPITPNGKTPDDVVAIRPIDFLLPKVFLDMPSRLDTEPPTWKGGITEQRTREHLDKLDNALSELWEAWSNGYLTNLRDSIVRKKRSTPQPPQVDQVVIVMEQLIARNKWPVARIVSLIPSKDGVIRSAVISCKGIEFKRAINQLIH